MKTSKTRTLKKAQTAPLTRTRFRLLAILLACAALSISPGSASDNPEATGISSGITANIQIHPPKATVGDPIRIDVDVTTPAGFELRPLRLPEHLGDISVLQVIPNAPVASVSNRGGAQPPAVQHHRAALIIAVYKTGKFQVPPIPLLLRSPEGQEITAHCPAATVEIVSILTPQDQALKDLKPQADISEPVRWARWIILALLLLGLSLLAWRLWKTRTRSAPPISAPQPGMDPLIATESQLRQLLSLRLLENGETKKFYVAFSEVVKRILEAGYHIQTIEKTTSELLAALRGPGHLSPSDSAWHTIESVLVACDLVKFAKYSPSAADNEAVVAGAFEMLQSVKQARTQAEMALKAEAS